MIMDEKTVILRKLELKKQALDLIMQEIICLSDSLIAMAEPDPKKAEKE